MSEDKTTTSKEVDTKDNADVNDTDNKNVDGVTKPAPKGKQPEADLDKGEASALSLEELNSTLGKNFKTKEDALKSLKDTNSFVGKKVDKIVDGTKDGEIDSDKYVSKTEFEDERFLRNNKEVAAHEDLLRSMRQGGQSLEEVSKTDVFKNASKAINAGNEAEDAKSVLQSNPKLGAAKDKMTQANESLEKGDIAAAKKNAVGAVLDLAEGE